MDDAIRLGYQAAVVSLESPTYRRLWLSIAHHPGNTVSCSQAEALVQAAEMRTGLRPMRRTELFCQRILSVQAYLNGVEQRLHAQQAAVEKAQLRLVAMGDRLLNDQLLLRQLEDE